jgi:predicted AlkP superfamily pyrophosphatase or phosphodiesterase
MATRGAYPVWFDTRGGCFTSSKAFGEKKPFWLNTFNQLACRKIQTQGTTQWHPRFALDHKAYQFSQAENDDFAGHPFSLMHEPQPLPNIESKKPYKLFCHTPQSNKTLFLLALHALEQLNKQNPLKPIVLFLSLSNLDFIGHYYGPDSVEAIDTLHHVDAQLGRFIEKVERMFGRTNCCWAFTGDHGGMSIPEVLNEKGIKKAKRIKTSDLVEQLNQSIYSYFNIKNMVMGIDAPDVWFAPSRWQGLSIEQQLSIADHVKGYLAAVDGIKRAWRSDELISGTGLRGINRFDRAHWFAKQHYPGRSGQVIFQLEPYSYITEYPKGTSHNSPYDYDVQVPLIMKWPGRLPTATIDSWVTSHQLAATLARILEVLPPRDANPRVLPGIE